VSKSLSGPMAPDEDDDDDDDEDNFSEFDDDDDGDLPLDGQQVQSHQQPPPRTIISVPGLDGDECSPAGSPSPLKTKIEHSR